MNSFTGCLVWAIIIVIAIAVVSVGASFVVDMM